MSDLAPVIQLAEAVIATAAQRGLMVATAESCTGGLVAAALTEVPGSSQVVERGFVTYTNAAKTELLAVPGSLLAAFGAVSEEVARAMAQGALARSRADIAVAVTGIAGPSGGTSDKPVGLVHFGLSRRGIGTIHAARHYGDQGRSPIRLASVQQALSMLLAAASDDIPAAAGGAQRLAHASARAP